MKSDDSTSRPLSKQAKIGEKTARLVMRYEAYLKNRDHLDPETIQSHLAAIRLLSECLKDGDFGSFDCRVATTLQRIVREKPSATTGKPRAPSTAQALLNQIKKFLTWLAREPGYRSKIRINDIEYLSPSRKDKALLYRPSLRAFPSIAQCISAFDVMLEETVVDRRNKAYVGMHLLTAGRTAAVVSLPIQAWNFSAQCVTFDARYCKTKFSKSFVSYFNPTPARVAELVEAWIVELQGLGFTSLDPIFPRCDHVWRRTDNAPQRKYYTSGAVLSKVLHGAFAGVGVSEITPHAIRTTMHRLVDDIAKNNMERKALSENHGHASETTTINSYSNLTETDKEAKMKKLRNRARKKFEW